jgi:phenylacetate-CoA ligase
VRRVADAMEPLRGGVLKPLLARLRGDRAFSHVGAFRRFLSLPADVQRRQAFERLRALLVHARETVPFHARRMAEAGFDPAAMTSAEDLAALRPLSRVEIQERAKELISGRYDPERLVVHRSGGTTSEPVPFFQSHESVALKNGAAMALRERMGWRVGYRTAFLWGATADGPARNLDALRRAKDFVLERLVSGSIFLAANDLSDARLDEYVESLRRFRPIVLQGYPSATDLLARRVAERGLALRVPLVVLTAEPTLDAQRARITAALGSDVLTFYGARECGWIAAECDTARRLHVNTAGVHLESLPDGRLVVTDLLNPAMPLIRYEIGDRGTLDRDPCPCGDPRPVLARLEGREVDVFVLPSGRRVPGVLADVRGLGWDGHGILDAQFVQERIDRLDVRWVAAPGLAPGDAESFRRHISSLFFEELDVVLHREDRIDPGPNGKVRRCLSMVTQAEVAAGASATRTQARARAIELGTTGRPAPRRLARRRRPAAPRDGVEPLYSVIVKPLAARARGDRAPLKTSSLAALLALPPAAMRRRQLAALRAIVTHAHATVPWYRERMDAAGFVPSELRSLDDLRRLPRLARTDLAGSAARLLSSTFTDAPLVEARTGGTTSAAVPFRQTREAVAWKDAAALVMKGRMGWKPGHRSAALWGAAQDGPPEAPDWARRLKNDVVRQVIDRSLWLPAGDLSDARLDEYAARLAQFAPHALQAYPSAADLLARRLISQGRRLSIPVVLLTAEPVLPEQRERIAEALAADVYTFYGARECGWIAAECGEHRLHVNTACVHLERDDDGSLLVTDLVNRAMPLLRYEIGDRGTLDPLPCPCGDARPVLAAVEGRLNDVFTLPSGRRVPGVVADLRAYRIGLGILEAQLVQDEPTTLDVNWVAGPQYRPGDEATMSERLNRMFFHELDVRLHRVERLVAAPNGKVRYCVSRVGTSP